MLVWWVCCPANRKRALTSECTVFFHLLLVSFFLSVRVCGLLFFPLLHLIFSSVYIARAVWFHFLRQWNVKNKRKRRNTNTHTHTHQHPETPFAERDAVTSYVVLREKDKKSAVRVLPPSPPQDADGHLTQCRPTIRGSLFGATSENGDTILTETTLFSFVIVVSVCAGSRFAGKNVREQTFSISRGREI